MIRVRSDDVGEVEYAAPESMTPEVGEVRWKRTFMFVARCMCEASSLPARAKTDFLSLVFAFRSKGEGGTKGGGGGVYLKERTPHSSSPSPVRRPVGEQALDRPVANRDVRRIRKGGTSRLTRKIWCNSPPRLLEI